ncbi:MAG: type II toxin-antitoxin system VapB family antitoxin [Candidatus Eremiobacteraeota bacterium]|nr:type II toxin-antitoxin system VapB family antitoxin [Candidatus Eremiobacteraeota bacterium]MCW5871358.1 type II toxin-antitoxin system VapB family antitoxin [Candidatus Eremiobacteraeota bacterium]
MTLNVKDPEAHRLAVAIAQCTGESLTRVVTEALRQRYEQIQRQKGRASLEELQLIAGRIAKHCPGTYVDHGSLLYDENGLPH